MVMRLTTILNHTIFLMSSFYAKMNKYSGLKNHGENLGR